MPDNEAPPAPDQNDPTGHVRPGSPTYVPGRMPANNMRPSASPRRKSSDEPREDPPRTGFLKRDDGGEPNVPSPTPPEGAPD